MCIRDSTEIEDKENDYLNGEASSLWLDRLSALFTGKQPQGASVELTIDPAAQQAAWDALGDQRGAVVAIEPKTGRVLALVSKPSYDPNELATHDTAAARDRYQELLNADGNPMSNRAIRGNTYPPGSTFKIVTSAAALESGQYTAETVIPAPDELPYPQSTQTMKNFGGSRCSPSASYAACWAAGSIVSSTDAPWGFWPVIMPWSRSIHSVLAWPLRNAFSLRSIADVPLTIEKNPVTCPNTGPLV